MEQILNTTLRSDLTKLFSWQEKKSVKNALEYSHGFIASALLHGPFITVW